jgi:uncharacterized repeat protein (TIGR01451 family)
VQDDAWVFISGVQGGNVSLNYSKKAWNDSKGADATSVNASKEDYITYTLTVTNNGNTPANSFVITDDLSGVLPYADMSDNGGGTVSGNVITYPALTIPAGGSVSKSSLDGNLAHQARDALLARPVTELLKVSQDARCTVGPARCCVTAFDLGSEQRVLFPALARHAMKPRVVAASRYLEHSAHARNRMNGLVRLHEPERFRGVRVASWANQADAFFRISRSSSSSATRARSR